MKKIYIGAAYYPELWDETEVDKDIARCKSLGVNTLRVGEFAWEKMEPKEGTFDLTWLLRIVDKLYAAGINTVMCTPTCTPPRWLLNKYEEIRRVMPDLIRSDVSSRCHVCKTSSIAREKNKLIVTHMAKVFSGHKGIIGWQIDNEIYPYDDGCFCENCQKAFRVYLKKKFGNIDSLNKAWGMARWSLSYVSFEEIVSPFPKQWRHPSLRKAWWDFQCLKVKTFVDEQADVLHSFGCENVGTDMMPQNCLDYYATNEKLDVVQYNHYEPASRLSCTAFAYDFLRCIKDRPFWVTETQVGWNGSTAAECGYRPVGNCYANTWLPIAKGAEMNLYWLFRTHPNGHELAHGALFSSAGRQYRVSEEVKQAAEELERCSQFLTQTKINSKIALHYSNTAVCNFMAAPILKDFDYRETLVQKYYAAFKHYNIDVIDTPHSLDNYEVVISPFLATADEFGFKQRVIEWIEAGGTWIVGPMSDILDSNMSKYTHAPYSFLEELADVYTKYQKPVDNDVFKAKWADSQPCQISTCFDAYETGKDSVSLVSYDKDEFDKLSVVTERKVGKGKIILVGSVLSHDDILKLVNKKPIAEADKNIVLVERSGEQNGIIAIETENTTGFIDLNGEYIEMLSGKKLKGKTELKPYEVLVLIK